MIPAHPLALTEKRTLDERRQVALTRYYCDAGAGGIAVGVHTTQFAIRDPAIGLFEPVLRLAQRTVARVVRASRSHPRPVMIAGVVGTRRHRRCARRRSRSRSATMRRCSALPRFATPAIATLLDHCSRVADVIPIVGFYLQPAVGGRVLDRAFWRGFFDIERVVAIKVAPFDRYRTLDVTTALAESGREDVALYTGNDDAIVADLLTPFPPADNGPAAALRRRPARPVGRLDEARGRDPAALPRRHGRRAGSRRTATRCAAAAGARRRAHRRQCRVVRSRASVRRVHSRHSRSPAPAGAARGTLVSRSARGPEPGTDGRDRPRARPLPAPDRRRVREGASAPMVVLRFRGCSGALALSSC